MPIALKADLKKELEEFVEMKVITRVNESTDWSSSMVALRRNNNKVQICLDQKDLNTAIQQPKYRYQTLRIFCQSKQRQKHFRSLMPRTVFGK